MITLEVRKREKKENPKKLRAGGFIPAVFYGPQEEATPIAIKEPDFLKVWSEAGGSTIVDLMVESATENGASAGGAGNKETLIHDVSWHPVTGKPVHVDFYCIERGKKLTVSVPLTFTGIAPVEKKDGIVVKVLHELEIEVQPRDIPHDIPVDLSVLTELDSHITVADLKLPEGVETTHEPTETVASVTQAQEEPEEEEERDISDVEIEGEKKEGEEGAEGAGEGEEKGKEGE